ncbi:NlpC/P60 family protein [Phyllobacterium sp. YR531]|uniref:NlpC/P60 family protein n=1 Tax=Phyllobacterium sp. YR531 TaxID=1144343 RepID=UPI00026F903D|nr:NlpC/P60 family protein [Phyllobacterium sp. YR531]EJN01420.1 putative phage cell wall peptidase, NlpC/P60 family [Phyllobacterium sp. YR531]
MTIAQEVLTEARLWVGTPYRHQGTKCQVGCDCLGLVRGIWRALYGREPQEISTYSPDWAEAGNGDPLLEAARQHMISKTREEAVPGDMLVFRWRDGTAAKHVGILAGPDHFIHAYEGHSVMDSALIPQWRRRIAGVFAFPPKV